MAKKAGKSRSGGNKSQAIRDYLKQHPDAGPTAIASALNAQEGWKISAAYVSTIKNKTNSSKRAGRRGRRGRPAGGAAVDMASLKQAKAFCQQAGGINQAKAALDLLAELTS